MKKSTLRGTAAALALTASAGVAASDNTVTTQKEGVVSTDTNVELLIASRSGCPQPGPGCRPRPFTDLGGEQNQLPQNPVIDGDLEAIFKELNA